MVNLSMTTLIQYLNSVLSATMMIKENMKNYDGKSKWINRFYRELNIFCIACEKYPSLSHF